MRVLHELNQNAQQNLSNDWKACESTSSSHSESKGIPATESGAL